MVKKSYSPQGSYEAEREEGEATGDKIHPSNTFLQAGQIAPCVMVLAAKSQNSHAK